jgi:hypothetical protein
MRSFEGVNHRLATLPHLANLPLWQRRLPIPIQFDAIFNQGFGFHPKM